MQHPCSSILRLSIRATAIVRMTTIRKSCDKWETRGLHKEQAEQRSTIQNVSTKPAQMLQFLVPLEMESCHRTACDTPTQVACMMCCHIQGELKDVVVESLSAPVVHFMKEGGGAKSKHQTRGVWFILQFWKTLPSHSEKTEPTALTGRPV